MFNTYPDIIAVDHLCEMLHIGKSSAYSLLHNKKIKHIKIGRKYLIPKTAVISFLGETVYNNSRIIDGELTVMEGDIV